MKIIKGAREEAKKIVIYGPEGIGKSTIGSKFPEPLFIDIEGSTSHYDVARTEQPTSYQMFLQQLMEIAKEKPCKTLVIDTMDWAERLIIQYVCQMKGWESIETPGYGAGYRYVFEEFGRLLNRLTELKDKGINIVILAHAALLKFEQPDEAGSYDRYTLKLINTPRCSDSRLLMEWADAVLFANYKTIVIKDSDTKKNKARGGERVLFTTHTPSWDAKNRFGMPDELPMKWESIEPLFKSEVKVEEPQAEEPKLVTPTEEVEETEDMKIIRELPQALQELMLKDNVTPNELATAVAEVGHFPKEMDIRNYPTDTPNGSYYDFLVSNWVNVMHTIRSNRPYVKPADYDELPF